MSLLLAGLMDWIAMQEPDAVYEAD